MISWLLQMFAEVPDKPVSPPEDEQEFDMTPLEQSYTKRDMILLAFEQNWQHIQDVEEGVEKGYDSFKVHFRFTLDGIPTEYMQKLAAEAKAKICEAK